MRRPVSVLMGTHRWRGYAVAAMASAMLAAGAVFGSPGRQAAVPVTPAISASTPTPAQTPPMQATPTQPPTSPTPAPVPTPQRAVFPTPASAADAMIVGGTLWVDARPATGEVLAFINGKQCGRGTSGLLQSDPPSAISTFVIQVDADRAHPGCGVPGAEVTLTVNGRAMNDPVPWRPGFQQQIVSIAGPAFAIYYGTLKVNAALPGLAVFPYIGGVLCGVNLVALAPDPVTLHYEVVVDPAELKPQCGRAGAYVEFHLRVAGQPDVVFDRAAWDAARPVARPTVDLSGRIPMPPSAPTELAR